MNKRDSVRVLEQLIQICEDGNIGYADAAEQATVQNLKVFFLQCSADCADAAEELRVLVLALGGIAKEADSLAGAAPRAGSRWMVRFCDVDLALLEAAESAELAAREGYMTALACKLAAAVRAVVQRQSEGASRHCKLIQTLRKDYESRTDYAVS